MKEKIKRKFGTYSNFCDCAVPKINRYNFQKDFLTKENLTLREVKRISALVDRTKNKSLEEYKKNIKLIRQKLNAIGGVREFCEKNPDFLENTVYQIISSDYYKRMTPKIEALMKRLGL